MASILKRRGRWMVNYRDALGRQRQPSFETRRGAEDHLAKVIQESRQETEPVVDPTITVKAYSERWLKQIESTIRPTTLAGYEQRLRLHILPAFGAIRVLHLTRGRIKTLLAEKLGTDLAKDSVRLIHATIRAMLNAALDDGVILANTSLGLGRVLRIVRSTEARQEAIKAFDKAQLSRLLGATLSKQPRFHPLFFVMSRTGLRIGEAFALQWDDLDFVTREIRVERALSTDGTVRTPKSGHGRTVDMSLAVKETLERHRNRRLEAWLKVPAPDDGEKGDFPAWVFPSEAWSLLDHANVGKAFRRSLKAAGLPGHFTPHCLRHTFATLLLVDGVSPAYVQEQLGHADISLTVGTYGRWLRKKAPGAVDRLDEGDSEPIGGKVVADATTGEADDSQVVDRNGAPRPIRTGDLQIRSLLLYPAELGAH